MNPGTPARWSAILVALASALVSGCGIPIPVSPCSSNNGGCDTNAICSASIGAVGATCACKAGYTGNGHTCQPTTCSSCDAHARCENWNGAKQCVCNAGFSGDGHTCTPDSPCVVDNGGCGDPAAGLCRFENDTKSCDCNAGYKLSNDTCVDVDECTEGSPCDANATCTNLVGAYSCACNDGFSGDGYLHATGPGCLTITYCEQQPGVCGHGACQDIPGSFLCTCDEGYELIPAVSPPDPRGFPGTCGDINETLGQNPCGSGTVTNTDGWYTCTCPSGQVFDQTTCVNDLCATNNGDCDDHADCAMVRGAVTCSCHVANPHIADDVTWYGDGLTCQRGFIAVSAGMPYFADSPAATTCGVRADGSLWCWGSNDGNELPAGQVDAASPILAASGEYSTVLSNGSGFFCALATDGTLLCKGANDKDQVNLAQGNYGSHVIDTSTNWSAVSCGWSFSVALKADGTLWSWGDNGSGQLGRGAIGVKNLLGQVGSDLWTAAAAGLRHACAISKQDKTLWCWGDNTHGELGQPTDGLAAANTPQIVVPPQMEQPDAGMESSADAGADGGTNMPQPMHWLSVAAGPDVTCAIRDDHTLWCWGLASTHLLGFHSDADVSTPTQVGSDTNWASVSIGSTSACALHADGAGFCWGNNDSGELGDGTTDGHEDPAPLLAPQPWQSLSVGGAYGCGVTRTGETRCWGNTRHGQLGSGAKTGDRLSPLQIGGGRAWTKVALGVKHTCALAANGSLWCWGSNSDGQLGDDTYTDRGTPHQVGTDTDWTDLMASQSFTCGLKRTGELFCWGTLGAQFHVPTPTSLGVTNVATLSSSSSTARHACYSETGGTIDCWGSANGYALGTGDLQDVGTPIALSFSNALSSLARGDTFTCGIQQADARLVCWGTSLPWLNTVKLPTVQSNDLWRSISAGLDAACGLTETGSFQCLGDSMNPIARVANRTGQRVNPADLFAAGTRWADIAVGKSHACAIQSDTGSLWCWGGPNTHGQLGIGTQAPPSAALPQVSQLGWKKVYAGDARTCALKNDSSLWCWGDDTYGQVGDDVLYATLPRQVF